MIKCTRVRGRLDVVATSRIEFCRPELSVCGIVIEVGKGGFIIELSLIQACHVGGFVDLA